MNKEKIVISKLMLMDVVLMRLSLIFLLVVTHAFSIYSGGWNKPYDSFPYIPMYDWFGMLFHGFRLQAMVFISGILFGYTLMRHPERLCFKSCVVRKAKRVLLPCYIFGIVYWLMFYYQPNVSLSVIGGGIWLILNGMGHLWFLPMIFWCFVITYILEKNGLCKTWLIPVLLICAAYNLLTMLPLGLGSVLKYYLFFYVGFMLSLGRIKMPQVKMWFPTILFIIAFCASMFIRDWSEVTTIIEKGLRFGVRGFVNIIIAVTGVYMLYRIANIPSIQKKIDGNKLLIKLSGYCYGVYIFQQFILKVLYYKTDMALCLNPYVLPWIATAATIALSLIFTGLLLRTRTGKFLIG